MSVGLILPLRSRLTGAGSRVGNPVAEVVVVQVEDTRRKSPDGRLLRNLYKHVGGHNKSSISHELFRYNLLISIKQLANVGLLPISNQS